LQNKPVVSHHITIDVRVAVNHDKFCLVKTCYMCLSLMPDDGYERKM